MVLKIFTNGEASDSLLAKDLGKRFENGGYAVEYYSAEDEACTNQLDLYDLYSFPSFVVTMDNGSEVECWRGKVPIYDDVLNFLNR